jgi:acylphosphatase
LEIDKIEMNKVRTRTCYSGKVQGVGFRWTVKNISNNFKIDGYVKNLVDGRVEMVAEGEAEQVSAFVEAISERMSGYIRDVKKEKEQPAGEERGFEIKF